MLPFLRLAVKAKRHQRIDECQNVQQFAAATHVFPQHWNRLLTCKSRCSFSTRKCSVPAAAGAELEEVEQHASGTSSRIDTATMRPGVVAKVERILQPGIHRPLVAEQVRMKRTNPGIATKSMAATASGNQALRKRRAGSAACLASFSLPNRDPDI